MLSLIDPNDAEILIALIVIGRQIIGAAISTGGLFQAAHFT